MGVKKIMKEGGLKEEKKYEIIERIGVKRIEGYKNELRMIMEEGKEYDERVKGRLRVE